MRKRILSMALVALMVGGPATQAGHRAANGSFHDYAEVVDVEPIIRRVEVSTPREQCWRQEVHRPAYPSESRGGSAGNMILGGIVGGVIGHQFGGGRGKDIATLAGTLVGASIGHDAAQRKTRHNHYDRVSYERKCRTVDEYHTEERVEGYRVTYAYNGRTFTTRMDHEPKDRLHVRVSLNPTR